MNDGEVPFEAGSRLKFTIDDAFKDKGSKEQIYIDYPRLPQVMAPGKFIFIDDGTLSFKVVEVGEKHGKSRFYSIATHYSPHLLPLPPLTKKKK